MCAPAVVRVPLVECEEALHAFYMRLLVDAERAGAFVAPLISSDEVGVNKPVPGAVRLRALATMPHVHA